MGFDRNLVAESPDTDEEVRAWTSRPRIPCNFVRGSDIYRMKHTQEQGME
jgi:hypothetical protein